VRPGIAVALAAIAIGSILLVEGAVLDAAWLLSEEVVVAEQARGDPSAVEGTIASPYPLALRPLAAHAEGEGLLDGGRQLNALLWAAIVFPAYALARRRAARRVALAAAALAALVPACIYATALLPDAPALLLAACSFALFPADEGRGRRWQLAAALACALASALVRPWFAVLPLALVLAYLLPRARWRSLAVWPRPLALVLLAGVAVTGIGGVSGDLQRALEDPGTIVRAGLASFAAAALGTAVVPWIVAWSRAGSARRDPLAALLACAGAGLAVAAGVTAAVSEPAARFDERPLAALAPLVFALAAQAWQRGGISPRALLVSGIALAAALLAVAWPDADPTLVGAPGLALAWQLLGDEAVTPAVLALVVVALAAALAWTRARSRLWAAAVAVAVAAGHAAAWRAADSAATATARTLLVPAGWIDERVSDGATVPLLLARGRSVAPAELAQLALTNRALGPLVAVDEASADPATGAIPAAVPDRIAFAVGAELAGRTLGANALGSLVRIEPPPRLAFVIQGVYPDGWTGERALYRRFDGPSGARTLELTLGRRAWTGPDAPGTVVVRVGRSGAPGAAVARVVVHAGDHRRLRLGVPPPPFDVELTVRPTFSPADFGLPDPRPLGIQVVFSYPAG
jgi:hypothetical protein